jgi:hypothetical protein
MPVAQHEYFVFVTVVIIYQDAWCLIGHIVNPGGARLAGEALAREFVNLFVYSWTSRW